MPTHEATRLPQRENHPPSPCQATRMHDRSPITPQTNIHSSKQGHPSYHARTPYNHPPRRWRRETARLGGRDRRLHGEDGTGLLQMPPWWLAQASHPSKRSKATHYGPHTNKPMKTMHHKGSRAKTIQDELRPTRTDQAALNAVPQLRTSTERGCLCPAFSGW